MDDLDGVFVVLFLEGLRGKVQLEGCVSLHVVGESFLGNKTSDLNGLVWIVGVISEFEAIDGLFVKREGLVELAGFFSCLAILKVISRKHQSITDNLSKLAHALERINGLECFLTLLALGIK